MKRCPECKFIYEDDQSLCDMDGILLVFDAEKLPKPPKTSRFQWRSRVIPALAAVVLSVVFVLVYYVSTRQSAKHASYSPASSISSQPASIETTPVVVINPIESKPSESKPAKVSPSTEPKTANSPATKPADPKRIKETKTTTEKTSTPTQTQKNDSKVESIFKKTGRILKKPFKF